jgi:hypothetical protein
MIPLFRRGPSVPPALPSLVWTDSALATNDATTYVFAGRNLGVAEGRSLVVAALHAVDFAALTVNAATIDGVSATVLATATRGLSTTALVAAVVPSSTTGAIAVTWSGGAFRCGCGVWAVYNLDSTTPTDTATATGGTSPVSASIDVEADGVVIAAASMVNGSGSATWTGVSEDYDFVGENPNECYSGAGDIFADAQTGLSISAAVSGTGFASIAAVALR